MYVKTGLSGVLFADSNKDEYEQSISRMKCEFPEYGDTPYLLSGGRKTQESPRYMYQRAIVKGRAIEGIVIVEVSGFYADFMRLYF